MDVLDAIALLLHLVVGVVLPGAVLVAASAHRWASRLELLVLATAAGLLLDTVDHFAAIGSPLPRHALPVLALLLLARPAVRRRLLGPAEGRLGRGGATATAAAVVVGTLLLVDDFVRRFPLDRPDLDLPPDLLFNMAVSAELSRGLDLRDPFVATERLSYHWLADAALAAVASGSGTSIEVVHLRLAPLLLGALVTLAGAALAFRLSAGSGRAAGLAALVLAAATELNVWPSAVSVIFPVTGYALWISPTLTASTFFLLCAALLAVPLLRSGVPVSGTWALFGATAFAAVASKASSGPLLLAAVLAAAAAAFARERSRRQLRVCAAMAGVVAVSGLVVWQVMLGGQVLGLRVVPLATGVTLAARVLGVASDDPPGLQLAGAAAMGLLVVLVLLPRIGGLAVPPGRRAWTDPATAFCTGGLLGGLVLSLGTAQLGGSQSAFLLSALPLGVAVSSAWLVAALSALQRPADAWRGAAAVAAATLAAVATSAVVGSPLDPTAAAVDRLGRLFVPVLVGAVAGVVAWLVGRPATPPARAATRVGALTALAVLPGALGTALVLGGAQTGSDRAVAAGGPGYVTADQRRALSWLAENSGREDLVATATHCNAPYVEDCIATRFVVAGLAGRRALLEGWSYSGRFRDNDRPDAAFWDRALLATNDAAFVDPSPARIAALGRDHGVRWLYAERLAAGAARSLDVLACRRAAFGEVRVYELGAPARRQCRVGGSS